MDDGRHMHMELTDLTYPFMLVTINRTAVSSCICRSQTLQWHEYLYTENFHWSIVLSSMKSPPKVLDIYSRKFSHRESQHTLTSCDIFRDVVHLAELYDLSYVNHTRNGEIFWLYIIAYISWSSITGIKPCH